MCFLLKIILLCDCAHLVVVCSRCCCRHECIPHSVVAVILTTSHGEAPLDDDDDDHAGRASSSSGGRRPAATILLLLRCRRSHRCRRIHGTFASLCRRRGHWVRHARRWDRRCCRSVRRDGVVVDDCAADGAPDAAVTATRSEGGGKNNIGGGSSTDRDNDDHDVDGNRHCRPCPRRATTAVAMMTMAGERGGEATVRRLQGEDEVMEMQRQSDRAPARAS